jgi:glycosyltransferase involved in cell wall biosynthesis
MKINFFTIVYNGMPFIKHHIKEFEKTEIDWHWHVVEGLAELSQDTAWSLSTGGVITDDQRNTTLSKDGTTEYIDTLKKEYPDKISVYRKDSGALWDGKIEMVRAPLANLKIECLLWQIDCDEHWNYQQIINVHKQFIQNKEKTAAWFWCNYYVGNDITISTRNCYAQNPNQEWLRVWRFRPGDDWTAHEPPVLIGNRDGSWVDIGRHNPFMHNEMENIGAVFEHYAYVIAEQLKFKETYYGYKGALKQWERMQLAIESQDNLKLGDYFHWVKDETMVKKNKKTRIVFVDHEYHKITQSSEFFIDILSSVGDVKIVWDKSHESTNTKFDIDAVRALKPDIIIIWQSEKAVLACVESGFSNIFFVPMFDSVVQASDDFWRKIKKVKVVNFSIATYNKCFQNEIISILVRYFNKNCNNNTNDVAELKTAFFWQRRKKPNINTIRPFLKQYKIKKLLLHNAKDPGVVFGNSPSLFDKIKYRIKKTNWFNSKNDFNDYVKKADLYFAPRLVEGIGMSFIEAMSNGQCVVAPDNPTMSEYITNGINGILYKENTAVAKKYNINEIRFNALRNSLNGYKNWQDDKKKVVEFLYNGLRKKNKRRLYSRLKTQNSICSNYKFPKVSICIVIRNAQDSILETIESVLNQDYPNLEVIVKDGCSNDRTLLILEDYKGSIDQIVSCADSSVYDGMNQAALLSSGEWVIYMNSGDTFFNKRVISNVFRNLIIPQNCAFIYGNHLEYNSTVTLRSVALRKPKLLKEVLLRIKNADYSGNILAAIPCHQAVFTRRDILINYSFNTTYSIAADHDLYFRVANAGFSSIQTGEVICNYQLGGVSSKNMKQTIKEWECIHLKYAQNKEAVQIFFKNFNKKHFIKNTLSWKITSPLRFANKKIYNLLCKKYIDK